MSLFQRGLLAARLPVVECRRFRGKINIQRPRLPHYHRQLAIDVCLPSFVKKRDPLAVCTLNVKRENKKEIDNPFEWILAKELYNWLSNSHMVAFMHLNSVNMRHKSKLFIELRKRNMHLRVYGKKIVNLATTDTHFESIQALFTSHTNIIFSEDIQVPTLLKILKKTPQLVLMAGIIHGQFLSRNEFVEYGNLPDLQVMRAQLCNVLQLAGSNVVDQLNQHQRILVGHLDGYVEQQTKLQADKSKPIEEPSMEDKPPSES